MAKKTIRSGKVPVIKKDLEGGTIAEANNDGTIFLDKNVKANSPLAKEAIAHEKVHMDQMARGDLDYDDNNVIWKGKKYPRASMEEGAKNLPWEKEAYDKTGNKNNNEEKIKVAEKQLDNGKESDSNPYDHNIYDRINKDHKKLNIPKNSKTQNNMGQSPTKLKKTSEGKPIRSAVRDLRKANKKLKRGEYSESSLHHTNAKETYTGLSDKGKTKAHKKMGRTLGSGRQWIKQHGEGPSSPANMSFGLSKGAIEGNQQTLNTFEDSAAGKVAMGGKALAGGIESGAQKNPDAVKSKKDASDLVNPTKMKASPITEKAKPYNKKEYEAGWAKVDADNKVKADEKTKREKSKGLNKLYENTLGRIDTKQERSQLKNDIKSKWLKFKKEKLGVQTPIAMNASPLKENSTAVEEFRAQSGGKVGDAKVTTTKSGTPGETKTRKTWKQAWADNDEGINSAYDSYDDYVKDRKGQMDADPEGYEKDLYDKTGVAGGPGSVTTEGDEKTETETEFDPDEKTTRGNYNMGYNEAVDAKWGEGVMHRDRKQNMRKYDRFSNQFGRGKAKINPETGEAFESAHDYATYKLGGKDWDTKYNTQVGKRGPDSTGSVDYDATEHGDLKEVTKGKTSTDSAVETVAQTEKDKKKEKDSPTPMKVKTKSFKMKGWSAYKNK